MVPGARRLAELPNGELLVGTAAGELVLVTSFGDQSPHARLEGPPVELVADPLGVWHARLEDGRVFAGGLWSAPRQVGDGASLLVQGCEAPRWFDGASAEVQGGASALGLAACDRYVVGSARGEVDGQPVSSAPIRRVQVVDHGVLWVDSAGGAGCLSCTSPVPSEGVSDAIPLHVVPLLPGEFAWIGVGGEIWIDGE